jgi:hypothetical protein
MSEEYYLNNVKELRNELVDLKLDFQDFLETRVMVCSQQPETREKILKILSLNYTLNDDQTILLLKPRFNPSNKIFNPELRSKAIHLYEKLKIHFDEYPFYQIPNQVNFLFIISKKKNYKHSFFCIVEGNVYETDEIYGDYLGIISKENSKIKLSLIATRRDELRDSLCKDKYFPDMNHVLDFLILYVKSRLIEELANRFTLLDSILQRGEENFAQLKSRYPSIPSSYNTTKILEIGQKRLLVNPFDGLFYLGYVMEHWIKKNVLQFHKVDVNNQKLFNILLYLEKKRTFSSKQMKVLHQIRIAYNNLRHNPDFIVYYKRVHSFYNEFEDIFLKKSKW